jgi:FAD synthase
VITIKFLKWIRNPIKFADNLELKGQLQKDEIACRFYFS